jgi:uncharacterized protein YndB with AHSA1/START domain
MADKVSVSRDIAADPQVVWDLLSDLPRMGEWSPETTGGSWKGGATGPAVGVRFSGRNRNGWHRWTTLATVTECDPPRCFAFEVTSGRIDVARWQYDLEATDGGCRVTETWTDRRPGWFRGVATLATGVRDRATHNREGMDDTLAALARAAERAGSA